VVQILATSRQQNFTTTKKQRFPGIIATLMLCSICQNALQIFWETTEGEIAHHPSLTSLAQAIEEGCFLCCCLEDRLEYHDIDMKQPDLDRCTRWRVYENDPNWSVNDVRCFDVCSWDKDHPDHAEVQLQCFSLRSNFIRSDPASSSEKNKDSSLSIFSGFTGSDQTISQIKKWLEICTSTHYSCGHQRKNLWMPSRLLQLCDLDKEPKVRLRSSSELESERYLTLSHCWGAKGSQKLQLTKETIEDFHRGIAVSTLQKTFQDMANVTARLGFQYFWVDCMCILQDDPEDWRRESSSMGTVYANSWLNISATWATDSSYGCFTDRDLSRDYLYVEEPMDGLESKKIWILTSTYDWSGQVEQAPVNERGWVLQERILSPRIAHFTGTQVAWECQQLQATETSPDGIILQQALYKQYRYNLAIDNSIKHDGHEDTEYYWSRILYNYTSCQLTFSTDRLIALSGIARKINESRPCDYIAGLWSKDLPHCLLWTLWDPSPQSKTYIAPSWSWASKSGEVISSGFADRDNSAAYMTVLDYAITLRNPEDPYGQITDAFIKVRARLGIARWSGMEYLEKQGEDVFITLLVPDAHCRTGTPTSTRRFSKSAIVLDHDGDSDLEEAYFAGVSTNLGFPVEEVNKSESSKTTTTSQRDSYLGGLLLRRLACSRFERIGLLRLDLHHNDDPCVDLPEREITII
jgi:hypothetical protein